mmetsp:Transcript_36588/g.79689  ORF Transcript_36588/g.79689 Transcript_36588/m.79689 type:complete len:103 (-) Transcript_36588:8-316(-)
MLVKGRYSLAIAFELTVEMGNMLCFRYMPRMKMLPSKNQLLELSFLRPFWLEERLPTDASALFMSTTPEVRPGKSDLQTCSTIEVRRYEGYNLDILVTNVFI